MKKLHWLFRSRSLVTLTTAKKDDVVLKTGKFGFSYLHVDLNLLGAVRGVDFRKVNTVFSQTFNRKICLEYAIRFWLFFNAKMYHSVIHCTATCYIKVLITRIIFLVVLSRSYNGNIVSSCCENLKEPQKQPNFYFHTGYSGNRQVLHTVSDNLCNLPTRLKYPSNG